MYPGGKARLDGYGAPVISADYPAGLKNPFSLDVFESLLYWVSQETGDVVQMDKFGRGVNQTVQSGLLMPRAVKIFHQKRYDQTSEGHLCEGSRNSTACCVAWRLIFRATTKERITLRSQNLSYVITS